MRRKNRWILLVAAAAVLTYAVPILVMAVFARGTRGYFHIGTCMGGHEEFGYIEGDGYYSYCPGHRDRRRLYSIRRDGPEWEVMKTNGVVAFRLRVVDGNVYRTAGFKTNWFREDRVYSPWRLWIPRLFPE